MDDKISQKVLQSGADFIGKALDGVAYTKYTLIADGHSEDSINELITKAIDAAEKKYRDKSKTELVIMGLFMALGEGE